MLPQTRYNNAQGYSPAQIIRGQHVASCPLYAIWRDEDVDAIKDWQQSRELTPDGYVGPETSTAMGLTWLATTNKPGMELWHDLSQRETLAKLPAIIDDMREMEIKRVVIQLDKSEPVDGLPRWRWETPELITFTDALADAGIEAGAMIWPHPTRKYIRAINPGLRAFDLSCWCELLEFDLEGQWRARHLTDPRWSMDDAACMLNNKMRQWPMEKSVTTYALHKENGEEARVTPATEECAPQAYSRSVPGSPAFDIGNVYGPGRFQRLAYDRAKKIPGEPEIALGFALWAQTGLCADDPQCGLDASYAASMALGVKRVRGWSAKHLWSASRGKPEYVEWLKELPGRLI